MGFINKLRRNAPALRKKAEGLAREHGDKADSGIDKAAGVANSATKGKYREQVENAAERAKDTVDDLGKDDPGTTRGQGPR